MGRLYVFGIIIFLVLLTGIGIILISISSDETTRLLNELSRDDALKADSSAKLWWGIALIISSTLILGGSFMVTYHNYHILRRPLRV